MTQVTAEHIKNLRETTGAGMLDCRKALTESAGDMEAAIDWLSFWLTGREDSPWYPSLRLFRQAAIGDWDGVIVRIGLLALTNRLPR